MKPGVNTYEFSFKIAEWTIFGIAEYYLYSKEDDRSGVEFQTYIELKLGTDGFSILEDYAFPSNYLQVDTNLNKLDIDRKVEQLIQKHYEDNFKR